MTVLRTTALALAVSVALVLQVTVFPHLAYDGVVPDLVLLVVVAAALVRGSQFAMVLGFCAGVLLDVAPPADHVAGRWALALVLVGYVAGLVRPESERPSALTSMLTVAVCSFTGVSVFALTGLVLRDDPLTVAQMLRVTGIGVGWDLLLTPFVLPPVMSVLRRLEPRRSNAPART